MWSLVHFSSDSYHCKQLQQILWKVQDWRGNILKVRDSIDRDVYKSYDCVFYRLVHLDKLRLATRREESEVLFDAGGKDPDIIVKAASESKGGVIEKLIKVDEDSALLYLLQKTLSYV